MAPTRPPPYYPPLKNIWANAHNVRRNSPVRRTIYVQYSPSPVQHVRHIQRSHTIAHQILVYADRLCQLMCGLRPIAHRPHPIKRSGPPMSIPKRAFCAKRLAPLYKRNTPEQALRTYVAKHADIAYTKLDWGEQQQALVEACRPRPARHRHRRTRRRIVRASTGRMGRPATARLASNRGAILQLP